ncbi:MAG: DUF5615 family PIN-like protein [Bacteroidetes bacterium]|nr:DUF5615 family PIN-like protein [Bacteroidota bacterium]
METYSASFLNLQNADNLEIFEFAKQKNAIIITKDDDFLKLIEKFGSPPKNHLANLWKYFKRKVEKYSKIIFLTSSSVIRLIRYC